MCERRVVWVAGRYWLGEDIPASCTNALQSGHWDMGFACTCVRTVLVSHNILLVFGNFSTATITNILLFIVPQDTIDHVVSLSPLLGSLFLPPLLPSPPLRPCQGSNKPAYKHRVHWSSFCESQSKNLEYSLVTIIFHI